MNSDRLRFRYWDDTIHEMKHPEKIIYQDNGNVFFSFNTYGNENEVLAFVFWPDREYPHAVMQSTGLRDKKNTLIYEGDVLNIGMNHRTDPPSPMYRSVKFDDDIHSCSCCFCDLRAVGLAVYEASGDDSSGWEIVGHIYQPEWEYLK